MDEYEKPSDVYAQEISKLEYLYPESIEYQMCTKEFNELDTIEIDYNSPLVRDKDPLKSYMDQFGPQESGKICKRCGISCQGHSGLIKFPISEITGRRLMIFHHHYLSVISKILKVICSECSSLVLDRNDTWTEERIDKILSLPRSERLKALVSTCKRPSGYTVCICTTKGPTGKNMLCPTKSKTKVQGSRLLREEKPAHKRREKAEDTKTSTNKPFVTSRNPRDVYETLMRISEETTEIIGITKQEMQSMFLEQFRVIPTRMRPRNGNNRTNKFTSCITKIISACKKYNDKNDDKVIGLLSEAFKQYFEEWMKLITKKEGLFKAAIQGKTGGASARAVVVPSSELRNGEAEISNFFATTSLCSEMHVNESNLEMCQLLMNEGKVHQIRKVRGKGAGQKVQVVTDNFSDRSNHRIEVGDVIWRHAKDGDVVIIVRQPTQCKHNVVGCTIKVNKDPSSYVTGLGMTITPGMNMDFDGDTSSIFIPQTVLSREDVENMSLSKNVRSSIKSQPMYGLVYHDILASALISLPGVEVSKELWAICTEKVFYDNLDRLPDYLKRLENEGVPKYSARGLISAAFPRDFQYEKDGVLIRNGIMISGMFKGSIMNASSGGIVDKMSIFYSGCSKTRGKCKCDEKCKLDGWKIVDDYITNASFILTRFLDSFGFTVGWKDMFFGDSVTEKVSHEIDKLFGDVMALKKPETYYERIKYNKDVESLVNKTASIPSDLGIFKYDVSKIPLVDEQGNKRDPSELARDQVANNLIYMSKLVSGAKGDEGNISNIGVLLGQQYLLGNVLSKVITGGRRFLVTDRPDSSLITQQGFVKRSYAGGQEPREMFMTSHSNREGMSSTQTNTPTIGILQKNLNKLMENLKATQGGAVFRDEVIINFSYGGDGLDAEEVLKVNGTRQALDIDTMLGVLNTRR